MKGRLPRHETGIPKSHLSRCEMFARRGNRSAIEAMNRIDEICKAGGKCTLFECGTIWTVKAEGGEG